jgi:phage terminase Nu1 subunit (DNA packaging protein)
MNSVTTVKRQVLARVLGISERRVSQLESEGAIEPTVRGKAGRPSLYALEKVIPAYLAARVSASAATSAPEARARRDAAQAEFTTLKSQQLRRDVVPRAQVIREVGSLVSGLRAAVLSLPRRLLQEGAIAPEQVSVAAGLMRDVLRDIASWRSVADIKLAVELEARASSSPSLKAGAGQGSTTRSEPRSGGPSGAPGSRPSELQ